MAHPFIPPIDSSFPRPFPLLEYRPGFGSLMGCGDDRSSEFGGLQNRRFQVRVLAAPLGIAVLPPGSGGS